MIDVLKMKLMWLLFGSRMRMNRTLIGVAVLFLLYIMNIIRMHFKFVGYLECIIIIFIFYRIIKKRFSKSIHDKIKYAVNLYELQKRDEALEILNTLIDEEFQYQNEKEKSEEYYECIFNKASCISTKVLRTGNEKYFKEALKLLEELHEYYVEKNKNIQIVKYFMGRLYFNFGYLKDNKEYLKIAEQNILSALEEDKNRNDKVICNELINCYMELSNYYNKEEYLEKALELTNNLINNLDEKKYTNFDASVYLDKVIILRKLSEINVDIDYENQGRESLNRAISILKKKRNRHYKKYFKALYGVQIFLELKANYEKYRITKDNKDIEKFRALAHELKEFDYEQKNLYINKKIDELLNEAIL